jgi:GH43 family beta-xylosidase
MKKHLLAITLLLLALQLKAQLTFTEFDPTIQIQHGCITTVDLNKDNKLDIIVSGDNVGAKSGIFMNNYPDAFTAQSTPNPANYINPIFNSDAADPSILKCTDGWFYCYSTSNPFPDGSYHFVPMLRSRNLTQWEYIGDAFSVPTTWLNNNNFGYWAPDVHYYNGIYYMYYAVASKTTDTQPTAIGLASSPSPTGPWSDQGKVLDITSEGLNAGAIDPFMYVDNGTPYLFFGSFTGIYAYQMSTDLKTKVGTRIKVAGDAFEAASIYKKGTYYYFIGSSGNCCGDAVTNPYRLTVARSTSLTSGYVDNLGNAIINNGHQGKLLLQQNAKWVNPGHNAAIMVDDAGKEFLIYHAEDAANVQIGSTSAPRRILCMDPITWSSNWPVIANNTPSQTSQASPTINTQPNSIFSVVNPGYSADIKVDDINGDGEPDVIYNGWGYNSFRNVGLALGQGNGVLANSAAYPMSTATISTGFADFNNDGLLDYYQAGNNGDNVHIFYQQTNGTFTDQILPTNWLDPNITLVDFNNDGWVDMFVNCWNNDTNNRYSGVLMNNNGSFVGATFIKVPIQKGYGSAFWADVDGDGYMDLLLNGDGGADGEGASDIYRLYKNNGGTGFTAKTTFSSYRQGSVGNGSRMVDWNNDGKMDIIISGWNGVDRRQETNIYYGNGDFTFTPYVNNNQIPGVSESALELGDLNNDGKIDLLISGYCGGTYNGITYNRNVTGYILNTQTLSANTAPSAPTSYSQSFTNNTGSAADVTFSWNAGIDTLTPANSLTYNLYLKNKSTGKTLYNPIADLPVAAGGTGTGFKRVTQYGNMFGVKSKTIKGLPYGNYEWCIQSVDGGFMGSPFTAVTPFTIGVTTGLNNNPTFMLTLSSENGVLKIQNGANQLASVKVFAISGALIKQIQVSGTSEVSLVQGVYLIESTFGTNKNIQKFIMN